MDRPDFTEEQEIWICEKIGEWYFEWKGKITNNHQHRLGIASDELKGTLCGEYKNTFMENLLK